MVITVTLSHLLTAQCDNDKEEEEEEEEEDAPSESSASISFLSHLTMSLTCIF